MRLWLLGEIRWGTDLVNSQPKRQRRRYRGYAAVRLSDLREGGGEEPGRIQPLNFTHRTIGVYKKIQSTPAIGRQRRFSASTRPPP